ncbi:MAG: MFS transporter [Bdellovibrionota bacterium]
MENIEKNDLSPMLLFLLTLGAAISVSTLYYTQPMLGLIRSEFHASVTTIGLIPSVTQIGYAIGLFFLAPLGDRYDRKTIILVKLCALLIALALSLLSTNLTMLIAASFITGIVATAAQDFVPAVAILSPSHSRGKNLGIVMTGLMLGILLSRVISGFISENYGWRMVFVFALTAIGFLLLLSYEMLPKFEPTTSYTYKKLMFSLFELIAKYRALRVVTLSQALLSLAFSAFWTTLAVVLQDQFQMGAGAAGAFGLAGAAGALAATLGGRLSDRFGPLYVSYAGSAIALVSFALLFFTDSITPDSRFMLLIICAVGFDFGVQASLVAHQSIMYGLDSGARSRLNAIFATGLFLGMATGSVAGGFIYANYQTRGLAILMTSSCALAIVLKMWQLRSKALLGRIPAA